MQNEVMSNDQSTQVDKKGKSLASFILGLVSIVTWLLPIFGLPTTIVGLVLGIQGRNSSKKWMSVVGIILCVVFLIVSVINAVLGAIRGVQTFNSLVH